VSGRHSNLGPTGYRRLIPRPACSVRYTATIETITTGVDGKVVYSIEYEDEAKHPVSRSTGLDTLSSMPVPARRFVEFGHDELKLIWEPDVHITNLHQDMLIHEEVPLPPHACPAQSSTTSSRLAPLPFSFPAPPLPPPPIHSPSPLFLLFFSPPLSPPLPPLPSPSQNSPLPSSLLFLPQLGVRGQSPPTRQRRAQQANSPPKRPGGGSAA
jgi:hypothetical protein